MSELVAVQISQERIKSIAYTVGRIVENPLVIAALQEIPSNPAENGLGRGLIEYRDGASFLSTRPSYEGQMPTEVSFYPEVPDIDVEGGIYWHGPDSNVRRRGELFGVYFDQEIEDGYYVNYYEVHEKKPGELIIGTVNRDHGTKNLVSPKESKLRELETKLSVLQIYAENAFRTSA